MSTFFLYFFIFPSLRMDDSPRSVWGGVISRYDLLALCARPYHPPTLAPTLSRSRQPPTAPGDGVTASSRVTCEKAGAQLWRLARLKPLHYLSLEGPCAFAVARLNGRSQTQKQCYRSRTETSSLAKCKESGRRFMCDSPGRRGAMDPGFPH